MAIDNDGKSLLISRKTRALLHNFTFKGPVAAAKFSPDGTFIAAAVGRLLQVILRLLPQSMKEPVGYAILKQIFIGLQEIFEHVNVCMEAGPYIFQTMQHL